MIDKNGKVFGKINLIDLLIILAIVAALIVLGVRAFVHSGPTGDDVLTFDKQVRITFFGNDVPDYVAESMKLGDTVSVYNSDIVFGELEDFSYEPAYTYSYDNETHEVVQVPVANRCFLTFSCVTTGDYKTNGLYVGNSNFVVGANIYINIGETRAGYQVKELELLENGSAAE